jgi:hypothetical protein
MYSSPWCQSYMLKPYLTYAYIFPDNLFLTAPTHCTPPPPPQELMDHVIKPVVPEKYLDEQTIFHLNPSGGFLDGGLDSGRGARAWGVMQCVPAIGGGAGDPQAMNVQDVKLIAQPRSHVCSRCVARPSCTSSHQVGEQGIGSHSVVGGCMLGWSSGKLRPVSCSTFAGCCMMDSVWGSW